MTTAWYYEYHEKGAFPHQQELCEAVRWAQCKFNLDGQSRVSPTHLTKMPTNPLTLRLRTLRKNMGQLNRAINHTNAEIKRQLDSQYDKNYRLPGMMRSLHLQDSVLKTGGAAIEEVVLDNGKVIIMQYDKVHFALYEFFTNLGSILDRLAYEINLLYELGDWVKERLDWRRLTNQHYLNKLNGKDQNLTKFIQAQKSNFRKIHKYRNRLVHDSIISADIETVGFPYRFHVYLPRNPNNTNSPMDVDAIEFCRKAKADVLKLLDGSYELMLQHLQSHGTPPW